MRTGLSPWGLNVSWPFSGVTLQGSYDFAGGVVRGRGNWPRRDVDDFMIKTPLCLDCAIAEEGEEAATNPLKAVGLGALGLGIVDPEAEGLRREAGGLEGKLVAHVGLLQLALEDLETLLGEGAEPLFDRGADAGVNQFLFAGLESRLERVARHDDGDPALRVAEVRRQGALRDRGLLDQHVDHRVVRVGDFLDLPTLLAVWVEQLGATIAKGGAKAANSAVVAKAAVCRGVGLKAWKREPVPGLQGRFGCLYAWERGCVHGSIVSVAKRDVKGGRRRWGDVDAL